MRASYLEQIRSQPLALSSKQDVISERLSLQFLTIGGRQSKSWSFNRLE